MKAEARALALAARAKAHAMGQGAAADHLASWLAPHAGKVLAGYLPLRTEIDPRPAMTAHAGPVCVPVVEGAGQPLRFRDWTPDGALERGPFGTTHPAMGAWRVPDIVILPLVAFDANGFRLGYGGGFYDRTLERLRAQGPVLAVGFAFAVQEMPAVPVEPTDQPLDAIITERGLTVF
ncbi:5-formyltetrahydrofolate cyclo-ligase [Falsirhodobacter sp. 1013]|uniref:5-formyltetrahydrofolate cyclo-ligase n=1 Tax=Falsirhodobacter sp. 1013 TaxID=3417566 RepID=UPI003EB7C4DD